MWKFRHEKKNKKCLLQSWRKFSSNQNEVFKSAFTQASQTYPAAPVMIAFFPSSRPPGLILVMSGITFSLLSFSLFLNQLSLFSIGFVILIEVPFLAEGMYFLQCRITEVENETLIGWLQLLGNGGLCQNDESREPVDGAG